MPDFSIEDLGLPQVVNPALNRFSFIDRIERHKRLLLDPHISQTTDQPLQSVDAKFSSLELAGPREKIFYEPSQTHAVVVTCGGLCPGLNAVIRALTLQLWQGYGVKKISGVRFGYQGFKDIGKGSNSNAVLELTPEVVENISNQGGTILGTSRGTPGVERIVDGLVSIGANVLFTVGGDGTMRGAREIAAEVKRRGLQIAVVGIPKTIDNDIPFVRQSFGFETAVAVACDAIEAAHEEARGARNGIGLVKVMGRNAGYIAANVTLATGNVNFCLVPEVQFQLEGKNGLFECIERRLKSAGHVVIAVAEGAGQYFFSGQKNSFDKSGNTKLHDIGLYLKSEITRHLESKSSDFTLKYIDPSYIIRAAPANYNDRTFCEQLGRSAVHAAMAGKTNLLIGYWHGRVTHIPLGALEGNRQTIRPEGELWFSVLETTGQPEQMS